MGKRNVRIERDDFEHFDLIKYFDATLLIVEQK